MASLSLTAPEVMSVAAFSLAWFSLGILAGRRLSAGRTSDQTRVPPKKDRGSRPIEIYVGNLSYDMTEKELHNAFRKYGHVVSARLITNKFNGKSRGFGFVQMEGRSDSEAAIKALHGKAVKGRKLVVNEAK